MEPRLTPPMPPDGAGEASGRNRCYRIRYGRPEPSITGIPGCIATLIGMFGPSGFPSTLCNWGRSTRSMSSIGIALSDTFWLSTMAAVKQRRWRKRTSSGPTQGTVHDFREGPQKRGRTVSSSALGGRGSGMSNCCQTAVSRTTTQPEAWVDGHAHLAQRARRPCGAP